MKKSLIAAVLAIAFAFVAVTALAETLILATVDRVVDGDTIKVFLKTGVRETVRLLGVDTPETVHPTKPVEVLGPEASKFMQEILPPGQQVYLELDVGHRDTYGRLLAYVYLPDERMVNTLLLQQGLAQLMTIPPNVKFADLFVSLQADAVKNRRGMWQSFPTNQHDSSTVQLIIDLRSETATLRNQSSEQIDLSGWRLISKVGNQVFTFPAGLHLEAQADITITSGERAPSGPGFLLWTSRYIWNNDGDPAELYNAEGLLVASVD